MVDIDAHYFENIPAFARYLDEPWKTRIRGWSGRYYSPIAGNAMTIDTSLGGRFTREPYPLDSHDGVVQIMAQLGVDVIVLLPQSLLTVGEITDKLRAVAFCNGFIEHMLNEVVDPRRGIYTLIVAPNQSPPDAAALIDRHAGHPGVCGVCLMTDGPVLPLGDSYYDPIYDACCRHRLPLVLHSGFGGAEGRESGFGLQTYAENHFAFVLNNQIQLLSMVYQGVPERFPELRLIWEEAGVFWIPLMMYRLDMEFSMLRSQLPWLKKPPSEYIKGFYFGTQPLERVPQPRHLKAVLDMIDAGRTLMFCTDWPHRDFDMPVVIERMTFLDAATRRRILGGNALEVLRFRDLGPMPGGAA